VWGGEIVDLTTGQPVGVGQFDGTTDHWDWSNDAFPAQGFVITGVMAGPFNGVVDYAHVPFVEGVRAQVSPLNAGQRLFQLDRCVASACETVMYLLVNGQDLTWWATSVLDGQDATPVGPQHELMFTPVAAGPTEQLRVVSQQPL